jgi:transketolase N-terminal domain/subunit
MDYLVKFRYYPGDPLKTITRKELGKIAESNSLEISLEEVKGDIQEIGEKTLDKDLETISQNVITVSGSNVHDVQRGLREIIKLYRSPRTVFSLWGSNEAGEQIAWETIEQMDGWW